MRKSILAVLLLLAGAAYAVEFKRFQLSFYDQAGSIFRQQRNKPWSLDICVRQHPEFTGRCVFIHLDGHVAPDGTHSVDVVGPGFSHTVTGE